MSSPPSRPDSAGPSHECVVVGAGLLGLCAAWALSGRGQQVLVLNPDVPGHAGAGSKGTARIFRTSYPDPLYVQMAILARALWQDLEAQSGRTLLAMVPLVNFGDELNEIALAMTQAGTPFRRLSEGEATRHFGGHLRTRGPALLEEGSGVLVADACLQALVDAGSFELRTGPPVVALRNVDDDHVTITLADGRALSAHMVVNCAGPNALHLLSDVDAPVAAAPSLQQVVYLRPNHHDTGIPLFIEWGDDTVYGLPVVGQRLLKLSHHAPGPPVAPEAVTSDEDDPRLVGKLLAAAARLLPAFDQTPVATERCVYDNTLDSDFIIDRVGRIVIGCGTSGHGFKFGPLLGEIMADLAVDVVPSVPLERFSLARPFRPGPTNP